MLECLLSPHAIKWSTIKDNRILQCGRAIDVYGSLMRCAGIRSALTDVQTPSGSKHQIMEFYRASRFRDPWPGFVLCPAQQVERYWTTLTKGTCQLAKEGRRKLATERRVRLETTNTSNGCNIPRSSCGRRHQYRSRHHVLLALHQTNRLRNKYAPSSRAPWD